MRLPRTPPQLAIRVGALNNRRVKKKPLTPRDIAILVVVVAIFVAVVAVFVWLFVDGTSPAFHRCGKDPCPFTIGGP
jgi:hypothetical protein